MRQQSLLVQTAKSASVYTQSKRVWDQFPYLRQIAEALVAQYDGYYYTRVSVNEIAISKAIIVFVKLKEQGVPDSTAFARYLYELFDNYAALDYHKVTVGNSEWDATAAVSYKNFAAAGEVMFRLNLEFDRRLQRKKLLQRFISDNDAIQTIEASI